MGGAPRAEGHRSACVGSRRGPIYCILSSFCVGWYGGPGVGITAPLPRSGQAPGQAVRLHGQQWGLPAHRVHGHRGADGAPEDVPAMRPPLDDGRKTPDPPTVPCSGVWQGVLCLTAWEGRAANTSHWSPALLSPSWGGWGSAGKPTAQASGEGTCLIDSALAKDNRWTSSFTTRRAGSSPSSRVNAGARAGGDGGMGGTMLGGSRQWKRRQWGGGAAPVGAGEGFGRGAGGNELPFAG